MAAFTLVTTERQLILSYYSSVPSPVGESSARPWISAAEEILRGLALLVMAWDAYLTEELSNVTGGTRLRLTLTSTDCRRPSRRLHYVCI